MNNTRRNKGRNFSDREKRTLLVVVSKYYHIVQNKLTDASSTRKKNAAWAAIAQEFNRTAESGYRDPTQLKTLFKNMKRKTRRLEYDDNDINYMSPIATDGLETNGEKEKLQNELVQVKIEEDEYTLECSERNGDVLAADQIRENAFEDDDAGSYENDYSMTTSPRTTSYDDVPLTVAGPSEICRVIDNAPTQVLNKRKRIRFSRKSKKKLKNVSTNSIKRTYFKVKLQLAKFQLKSAKVQHCMDMRIKRAQLRKLSCDLG